MCRKVDGDLTLANFLSDPLVRLAMASDGVTESELRTVLRDARSAMAARDAAAGVRHEAAPAAPRQDRRIAAPLRIP